MNQVLPLGALILLLFGVTGAFRGGASPKRLPTTAVRPVLVELFTSEGCSSCPPADALLAKLETTQPIPGAQIIAIEEHVDYWDRLGWKDPYSSPQWTDRQISYASAFGQEGEYTPQMVVGGRSQFVGSRSQVAEKSISEATELANADVEIERLDSADQGELRLRISAARLPELSTGDSAEIWLAITESGLASQVTAGENSGRRLQHASVLRSLQLLGAASGNGTGVSFRGERSVKLKADWKRARLSVVVFVQEKRSRHILGAASLRAVG